MTLKQFISILQVFLMMPFISEGQDLIAPIAGENLVFEETDGLVAVEAEHFFKQTKNEQRKWYRTSAVEWPETGRDIDSPHPKSAGNNAYLEILPDTRSTHADKLIHGENFSNKAGEMAILHYKVKINNPGRYYVWARAFSTGTEDNGILVGIDGNWPESGARMQWCDGKNSWRWESKQRTAEEHCGVPHLIYLDIENPGIHEIQFSMREDGFEFDRFLLTNEKEYVPEGVGPEVAVATGILPESFPVAEKNPGEPEITGELKKWHTVELVFEGPETSEMDKNNPFLNYRLDVTFLARDKKYLVPGFYAADGNSAETSATSGNTWKVRFTPDETGEWSYLVSFKKGKNIAVKDDFAGAEGAGFMDGAKGSFTIADTDKSLPDNRAKGRLNYIGKRYLQFEETGEYFIKVGVDAPENLLAYEDIDDTPNALGFRKNWEPHAKDFESDASAYLWQGEKGKNLLGAINYLGSEKLNVFSFLTFNIDGDDRNVYPYLLKVSEKIYEEYASDKKNKEAWETMFHKTRFDVSKMEQWERIFSYGEQKGMFLHFKTHETETDHLMDNGFFGLEARLYYRELIARFGHHLALNWNLGEENNQPLEEVKKAARYVYNLDPYKHHLVIHTFPNQDDRYAGLIGNQSPLTGASLQLSQTNFSDVHDRVLKWRAKSDSTGKPWALAVDEPGSAKFALLPDDEDREHNHARSNALWGTLTAGGYGVEWYFGYSSPNSDLTCEDFRSRDLFWDQNRYALDFFTDNNIPFWLTENHDELVAEGDYCLAIPGYLYIVYLKKGKGTINLENTTGNYSVKWYDPRNGGALQSGKLENLEGGKTFNLKGAPSEPEKDWVVLIRK